MTTLEFVDARVQIVAGRDRKIRIAILPNLEASGYDPSEITLTLEQADEFADALLATRFGISGAKGNGTT